MPSALETKLGVISWLTMSSALLWLACTEVLQKEDEALPRKGLESQAPKVTAHEWWRDTGSMAAARARHTATLLPSGKVLVAGGDDYGALSSAEVYDPVTEAWSSTGALAMARSAHTATLLPSGKVLVTGGEDWGGRLASAEVYDPATETWSPTGALTKARALHTATLLPSGKVLVVGGFGKNFEPLASTELYDPITGAWSPTGTLATARALHTATLLPSGTVLVTGGFADSDGYLSSAELYNPVTGAWSPTGTLATARSAHTATLLPSGKVLVIEGDAWNSRTDVEVYDPITGGWSSMGTPATVRAHHTATLLPSGKVLIIGGHWSGSFYSAEVYDPVSGAWSPISAALSTEHYLHTATLLPAGKVLLSGGKHLYGQFAFAKVYNPPLPRVLFPAYGWTTNNTRPIYGGVAEPGSAITVIVDGTPVGTTTANGSGRWDFIQPLALADGAHTVKAWAPNAGDNPGSESDAHTFVVDTTPPAVPVVLVPADGSTINTPQPTFRGAAEPGSTVTVIVDGTPVGTMIAKGSGVWDFIQSVALAAGSHTVEVRATDAGGNTSPESTSHTFVVDLTPPAPPEVLAPANGSTTSTRPIYSGAAESGSTVTVLVDGTPVGTTAANASGMWDFMQPMALAADSHTVKVKATDAGGNTSPESNSHTFTVDATPPAAPVVLTPVNGSTINNTRPTYSGTAEASSTVMVRLDETVAGFARADEAGLWSFPPATALSEGLHLAEAISADEAGNASPSKAWAFTVDSVAPEAPEVTMPGAVVNTPLPAIGGRAEAGSTVTLWLDEAVAGIAKTDARGIWLFTPATALPEGPHRVRATAADSVNNASPFSTVHPFTVDTVAPGAPEVRSPGASIKTQKPAIGGTAEVWSTVTVSVDGIIVGAAIANEAGAWSVTPVAALAVGRHLAVATSQDEAGNTSLPSTEYSFIIPRSHYGWSCATAPALPGAWALLALALALRRCSRRSPPQLIILAAVLLTVLPTESQASGASFTLFESGQVRPLALSPSGQASFIVCGRDEAKLSEDGHLGDSGP